MTTWMVPYFAGGVVGFVLYRERRRVAILIGLGCIAFPFAARAVLNAERQHTPLVYDGTLTRIDGEAGGALIAASERLLVASPVLLALEKVVYTWNLPLVLLVALGRRRDLQLPIALTCAAVLGVALYLIVPALGPGFFWPAFPKPPLVRLGSTTAQSAEFRNAMPSVHFASTLIAATYAWSRGTVTRWFGIGLVAATMLATLGSGQHYVIDLIVALPFSAAIWLGVARRHWPAVACGVATLAALTALRFMR